MLDVAKSQMQNKGGKGQGVVVDSQHSNKPKGGGPDSGHSGEIQRGDVDSHRSVSDWFLSSKKPRSAPWGNYESACLVQWLDVDAVIFNRLDHVSHGIWMTTKTEFTMGSLNTRAFFLLSDRLEAHMKWPYKIGSARSDGKMAISKALVQSNDKKTELKAMNTEEYG